MFYENNLIENIFLEIKFNREHWVLFWKSITLGIFLNKIAFIIYTCLM